MKLFTTKEINSFKKYTSILNKVAQSDTNIKSKDYEKLELVNNLNKIISNKKYR